MLKPPPSLLAGASLFLDFDGTLVELAEAPDAVRVDDGVRLLLARLQCKLGGRLAVLSGRALTDVRSWLHPIPLAVGGSHGLEIAHAGEPGTAIDPMPGLAATVLRLRELAAEKAGVLIEEKPGGVAVHYRQAPHAEAVCIETAARLAADTGMSLQHGKMVVELKAAGVSKGEALKAFMKAPRFAGTKPICVGDDLTDEEGFAAASALGGAGILVGSPRATQAVYRLDDVSDVRRWLAAACELLA